MKENPIDFMADALDSLMHAGKIIIEKDENSIDIKVRVDTDKPMLLGLLFMESMLSIAKRSKMHEFSIASACEQTLAEIREEADHE